MKKSKLLFVIKTNKQIKQENNEKKENKAKQLTFDLWFSLRITAWKVSKYGVFSGPYFPVFEPEKTPYLDSFHVVVDYYHQNLNGLVALRVVEQRKT